MTLAEKLLLELNDWRPSSRDTLTVDHAGSVATITADRNNELGLLAWEISVERPAPDGATLRGWAESIAARSSGLLERLRMLEVDDSRSEAILRSDRPTEKADALAYYEVRLHGTTRATVHRYRADRAAGGKREQVAFALTHEVLAKLIDDIVA